MSDQDCNAKYLKALQDAFKQAQEVRAEEARRQATPDPKALCEAVKGCLGEALQARCTPDATYVVARFYESPKKVTGVKFKDGSDHCFGEEEVHAESLFKLICCDAAFYKDDDELGFEDWIIPFDGNTGTEKPLREIERCRVEMHKNALAQPKGQHPASASKGWRRKDVAKVIVAALKAVPSGAQAVGVPEMQYYPKPKTTKAAAKDAEKLIAQIQKIRSHPLLSGLRKHGAGADLWTESLYSACSDSVTAEGGWGAHGYDTKDAVNEILAPGADPLSHMADYVSCIRRAILAEQRNVAKRVDPKTQQSRAFFDSAMWGFSEIAQCGVVGANSDWPFDGLVSPVYDLAAILFEAEGVDAKKTASSRNERIKKWVEKHKVRWPRSLNNNN